MNFLGRFEAEFVNQGINENRDIFDSLDLAWTLLRTFPREQLNRIPKKILDEFYSRKSPKEQREAQAQAQAQAPKEDRDD